MDHAKKRKDIGKYIAGMAVDEARTFLAQLTNIVEAKAALADAQLKLSVPAKEPEPEGETVTK